ncbi:hypothetical protein EJ06DRAFT_579707 [Trichodelitschia bisporula]|uniref:WD40 repeat-like protein n=1 Tax=Trichodelitschia bisporula TaxID=703511 RepID=A0A6G1I638_9PEZI|nr:hypothetical protein EJ06DRAFT_579707 [Trichodelitschia bisporula]
MQSTPYRPAGGPTTLTTSPPLPPPPLEALTYHLPPPPPPPPPPPQIHNTFFALTPPGPTFTPTPLLTSSLPSPSAPRSASPTYLPTPRHPPDRNHDMNSFLRLWHLSHLHGERPTAPLPTLAPLQHARPPLITAPVTDPQAIPWTQLGTTRATARAQRAAYFARSVPWPAVPPLPEAGSAFLGFERMLAEPVPWVEHRELRHLVTASSAYDLYTTSRSGLVHAAPDGAMERLPLPAGFRTTCLAAGGGVLAAGSFGGSFALLDLQAERDAPGLVGKVGDRGQIVNHVHVPPGGGGGGVVFTSNDGGIRGLDIETGKWVSEVRVKWPVNCAVTGPCGRVRLCTGDRGGGAVLDARAGRRGVVEEWAGLGPGFGVDWAGDGFAVAVGGEDGVRIRDARMWRKVVAGWGASSEVVRSVAFSPLGAGRRLLLVGEGADGVGVVDGVTWGARQGLDVFGVVAGGTWMDDGGVWSETDMYVSEGPLPSKDTHVPKATYKAVSPEAL